MAKYGKIIIKKKHVMILQSVNYVTCSKLLSKILEKKLILQRKKNNRIEILLYSFLPVVRRILARFSHFNFEKKIK